MGLGAAAAGASLASSAGSLIGGAISAAGQSAGSKQQAAGYQQGAATGQQNLTNVKAAYAPYQALGTTGTSDLTSQIPALTSVFQPTQAQLAATPGYQFTRDQGLQATQNGYAAQGLGSSGAALKGASNYAENLASTTYNQQLQNYLNQNQQIYNKLLGLTNVGEGATTNLGQQTLGFNNQIAGAQEGVGTALGAGTAGSANTLGGAIGNALGGLGNAATGYAGANLLNGGQAATIQPATITSGSTPLTGLNDGINYLPQSGGGY